jgi:Dolichyl-phosphate-mannose-protein mannosyltransferase
VLGAVLALLGLLDPALRALGLAGAALSAAAAIVARGGGAGPLPALAALTGVGFTVAALAGPEFRADAPGYYVYLRSLAIDHDLDFANEWDRWGFPALPVTATGRRPNLYSIGPAIAWAPFFAAAHVYVLLTRLLGLGRWVPDGYGAPYLAAMAAGSVTAVVLGAFLLARSMRGYLTARQAAVVVGGAVLASPIAYYTFVVPGMAHALTFALASAAIWAFLRAEEAPSARRWVLLGLFVGLATLARWQALVLALLPATLAVRQVRARRARPAWIAAAAVAALLAFVPQMVAWKLLFGRWLTMPQGREYVDWSSPHFLDVLVSAQRGFFDWTPAMLAGTLGLVVLAAQRPAFALPGLAVLVATAWVNGGVKDWEASDAFGARRFDLVVPFAAWGLAALARALAGALQRRPWVAVAALLAGLATWNAGFIRLYRSRGVIEAAPLDWLAGAQARQLARLLDAAAAPLGPRARGLVYNAMVGEYFYYNVNLSGTIDVGAADSRWLAGGWSDAERREGWPPFRWALSPLACVRVPLQQPIALRSFIRLRSPGRIPVQELKVLANGAEVGRASFGTEWTDLPFVVPAESLHPGMNSVCFEFERSRPGDDEGGYAAAVSLVQLP